MERHVRGLLFALVVLCLAVGGANAAAYVLTDLGLPPGATSGTPVGMSSDGRLVGACWVPAPTPENPYGAWCPFTWANGVFTALDVLEGDTDPYATAINSRGQVVGWSVIAVDMGEYDDYCARACLWEGSVPTALQVPAEAVESGAFAISDEGVIVGIYGVPSEEYYRVYHACYWQPEADGSYSAAQVLAEGEASESSAVGVNRSGQIVGFVGGEDGWHACRWDEPTAVPVDLGRPPAYEYFDVGGPLYISDSGLLTGNSWWGPDTDLPHALLWQDGAATMLPGLGGLQWAASGINSAGLISGTIRMPDTYESRACVWDGNNPTADPILIGVGWPSASTAAGIDATGQVAGNFLAPPDDHSSNNHEHWCLWQPVTISYTGDSLVPAGTVSLRAQFQPAGATDMVNGVGVTFTLTSGALDPVVVTATTAADRSASASVQLATGVYSVVAAATVDGQSIETSALLVVYDPSGGFVTGHGSIDSPAGALAANPEVSGKAAFGFVSKYQKGATRPIGTTRFQFKVAGLTFHSESYDWLVVAGAKAQYKGTGAINGAGSYAFMLTAVDGDMSGGGGVDRFRIKIWDPATDTMVYDNQIGSEDGAELTTALASGDIMIHKQ